MKDYSNILNKWSVFSAGGKELRKEVLDALHPEIKKSFNVITKISIQEIEGRIENKDFFGSVKQLMEGLLAFSIFGGYLLFLVENGIDPTEGGLIERNATMELGKIWVGEQKKDNMKEMLGKIDPIISMFLHKGKQSRMNQLFTGFPDSMNRIYKEIALLDKFIGWAGHQGYIVGQIEFDLNNPSSNHSNIQQSEIKEA